MFCEAKRTSPSILYIPHIQQWWETAGPALRASFLSLLGSIPSFTPILLLATCSVPHQQLDPEVSSWTEPWSETFSLSHLLHQIMVFSSFVHRKPNTFRLLERTNWKENHYGRALASVSILRFSFCSGKITGRFTPSVFPPGRRGQTSSRTSFWTRRPRLHPPTKKHVCYFGGFTCFLSPECWMIKHQHKL